MRPIAAKVVAARATCVASSAAHWATKPSTKPKSSNPPKPKTRKPSMYKVLLLNDDYTPMEFVVHVLQKFFHKGPEDAARIMLHVHHNGVGVAGVFTREVAETKVERTVRLARAQEFPLRLTMEPEEEEET